MYIKRVCTGFLEIFGMYKIHSWTFETSNIEPYYRTAASKIVGYGWTNRGEEGLSELWSQY